MRRLAAVVIAMAMLSSCTTYRGSVRTAKVGVATAGAGLARLLVFGVLLGATTHGSGNGPTCNDGTARPFCVIGLFGWIGSFLAVPAGLGISGLGLVGMLIHPKTTPEEEERARAEEARKGSAADRVKAAAQAREQAWTLTREAATAARDDTCAIVMERSAQVRELDLEFHDTVFVRDVAIKRCMDAASARSAQPPAAKPSLMQMRTPDAEPASTH